jgi:hypothetical protein
MPFQSFSSYKSISQRLIASLCAIVLALQSGCALPTRPVVPKTQYQATLGRVAIVATSQAPDIKLEFLVRSKGEGAVKGAGSTFLSCMGGMGSGSCSGEMCGAVYALWFVACGVAGVVGGVAGAVSAPGSEKVRTAENNIYAALAVENIQESLREQIVAAATANGTRLVSVSPESMQLVAQLRDYRSLAAAGVDTVLEVTLVKVSTGSLNLMGTEVKGEGSNPALYLLMTAHVRLIRTSDNIEVFASDYFYSGERLRLSEWAANNAEPLLHSLQVGYSVLAAHIYENIFMLYPFPDREGHMSGWLSSAFGLAPIYPRLAGPGPEEETFFTPSHWTVVDSLQPTLLWQAFPRDTDVHEAPDEMAHVKNVRYDLIVARENNYAPAEVVYRQNGLSRNTHTIQISLRPATRYFWTVRARFELHGRERVTEWGVSNYSYREKWTAPIQWSYRFKTPQ